MPHPRLPPTASSVGRKIGRLVLTTTFAALLLAGIALLVYEARTYREAWVSDLTTQAEILARSSAPALAFEDPQTARANLALLQAREGVDAAAIFKADGSLFASYTRNSADVAPSLPPWRGNRVEGGKLLLAQPIVENGETLGTVYLSARYDLAQRIRDYLLILGAVMLGALLVALIVSARLQRTITEPIAALTQATRKVIDERDFSERVKKTTDDEIGTLVDGFNSMLGEVGERAEALREADRRKDEFLATLAHELRNPLAPMVNAIAILRRPGVSPDITERAHGMMERQLAQMVRLVDDLLDVARITTGKLTIHKQSAELAAIVRSAVETARPLIDSRRHELRVELPAEPVYLNADATRLAQVFSNLLNNAAKYTDEGGHIQLTAQVEERDAVVEIRDDGIGIAPEMLPRVFEMFAQADNSIERKQSGLGVGLTLARRFIELHGGSIEAHSSGLRRGSSFRVRLPVMAALASHNRGSGASKGSGDPDALRILLVDDNVDFVSSLAVLLQTLGHEVRVAHDARDALAAADEFAPDFAFLDIGLPEVSGYELAAQLRASPRTAATTLVAVSGWGQEKDRERSQQAGFALHLVKPVEFEKIQAVLSQLPPGR
jgi:two-component system, sensor histidine kinase